jgi:hypothetical protein
MPPAISGRDTFYQRLEISNVEFGQQPNVVYGFAAQHLILVNDGKATLSFSFNGEDLDGEIFRCDKSLSLAWKGHSKLWLKVSSVTPATQVRIWAWVE